MNASRRRESGNVVESALVALPLISILLLAIGISQFFGAIGMVTLDVVAANMEAITRINELGKDKANPPNLTATNGWHQLFHSHQSPQLTSEAILASAGQQLNNAVRLSIANSASGIASYHNNAFGIPADQSINYDAQAIRFVQIITSTTTTTVDGNGIVVLDYQPSILRLVGAKSKVSAALLNPLMDYTSNIITTFSNVNPDNSVNLFNKFAQANNPLYTVEGETGGPSGPSSGP